MYKRTAVYFANIWFNLSIHVARIMIAELVKHGSAHIMDHICFEGSRIAHQ